MKIKKRKLGFSIIEILVALIVVSVITAALAPVITKKLTGSSVTVLGGNNGGGTTEGTFNEEDIETECEIENCLVCLNDKCITCKPNYELKNGECESLLIERAPMNQADCDMYNAHYFEGTCITKGNVGDTTYGGPDISFIDEIQKRAPSTTRCTKAECCFVGTTADTCGTYTDSSYSSCTRTLCTQSAAKLACERYNPVNANTGEQNETLGNWHLPTKAQLIAWNNSNNNNDLSASVSKLSRYLGKRGLDLVTWESTNLDYRHGAAHYGRKEACAAMSGGDKLCYTFRVWGEEESEGSANAHYFHLSGTTSELGTSAKDSYGYSARCVLDKINAKIPPAEKPTDTTNYVTPNSQADCDPYNAHYFNGTCITKANSGDTNYGGAPLSSAGVTNAGQGVSDYGIQILAPGSYCTTRTCCWQGTTAGSGNTFVSSQYSSLKRTMCNWWAADIACKKYNPINSINNAENETKGLWELPSQNDLNYWVDSCKTDVGSSVSKLSRYLGNKGLDLCDWDTNYATTIYGSALCNRTEDCIHPGPDDNYCWTPYIWGQEQDASKAIVFHLSSGVGTITTSISKAEGGKGSRCVLRKVKQHYPSPAKKVADATNYHTPQSQADCEPYNAHYFNGTCITRGNVGDTANNGVPISTTGVATKNSFTDYNIYVLPVGGDCATKSCCWLGTTAGTCGAFTKSGYSTCNRTMCTWWAADIACKNYNPTNSITNAQDETIGLWELPDETDLTQWVNAYQNDISASVSTLSRYLGDKGLDLCDWDTNYGTTRYGGAVCGRLESCIISGPDDNYCWTPHLWGASMTNDETNTLAYTFHVNSGVGILTGSVSKTNGGKNARCILRKVKDIYTKAPLEDDRVTKTPESQDDCTRFNAIYHNGTCITKYNVGDNNGPKLDTQNNSNTGIITDLGIYVLAPGGSCTTRHCCWTGNKTTSTSACGSYTANSYSSCKRTMCSWHAAKTACENYDVGNSKGLWRLPKLNELKSWQSVIDNETANSARLSRYLGENGLDLCDWNTSSNYGSSKCDRLESCSISGVSSYCAAMQVWGEETDAKTANTISLSAGKTTITSNVSKFDGGKSARCVTDKIPLN